MTNWLNLIFNEYITMIISSSLILLIIYFASSFMLKNTPKIILSDFPLPKDDLAQLEKEKQELAEEFKFKEDEIKEFTTMREMGASQQQALKLLHLFGKDREIYKKKLQDHYMQREVSSS